jgi:hypothetical protein
LVITWKATNQTTYLEFTTNMASGWTDASLIATLTNDIFQVTWTNNPLTSRNSFFRLRVAP